MERKFNTCTESQLCYRDLKPEKFTIGSRRSSENYRLWIAKNALKRSHMDPVWNSRISSHRDHSDTYEKILAARLNGPNYIDAVAKKGYD
ncbi:Casein kinase I isoform gamma-1, partial [Orchesella cincta]